MTVELISHRKWFQLFQPIGGVRARLLWRVGMGEVGRKGRRKAVRSLNTRVRARKMIMMRQRCLMVDGWGDDELLWESLLLL
jgi:hypothetical protein